MTGETATLPIKPTPLWHREFCSCGARMSLIQAAYTSKPKQVLFCLACGEEKEVRGNGA